MKKMMRLAILCISALALYACASVEESYQGQKADSPFTQKRSDLTFEQRLTRLETDMMMIMRDVAIIAQRDEAQRPPAIPAVDLQQRAAEQRAKAAEITKPKSILKQSKAPSAQEVERLEDMETVMAKAIAQEDLEKEIFGTVLSPEVTASIAPEPAALGWRNSIPESKTPVRLSTEQKGLEGKLGLHLASFKKTKTLSAARDLALAEQGELLSGLEFFAEPIELNGETMYRLKVGPVASKSVGANLCQAIRERGSYCAVSAFGADRYN